MSWEEEQNEKWLNQQATTISDLKKEIASLKQASCLLKSDRDRLQKLFDSLIDDTEPNKNN